MAVKILNMHIICRVAIRAELCPTALDSRMVDGDVLSPSNETTYFLLAFVIARALELFVRSGMWGQNRVNVVACPIHERAQFKE